MIFCGVFNPPSHTEQSTRAREHDQNRQSSRMDRSLPVVAELLVLSAQSALAHWFRERFGKSITQWRSGSS
jgi:hypothetical protein